MSRLQLELSDTYEALIDKLQPLCDLKTKKDVVENALLLLGWAATEASRGLSIAAVDESRRVYKEVHAAALEGAKTFQARRDRMKPPITRPADTPQPQLAPARRAAARRAAAD
jgi:hypothetical protein